MLNMLNGGYRYEERLDRSASGVTVLDYLVGRYSHSSEDAWEQRIEAGRVFVNGAPVVASTKLSAGAVLAWDRPPWVEPEAPSSFAVLYRDGDVLAVAKPRGLAAMPGGGFLERTLLRRVARLDPAAAPLHRLGRATSGITLFSRHTDARRRLTNAWRTGAVERSYVGLVRGKPPWREVRVDEPIGPVPHARLGSVAALSPDGKPAESHVRLVEHRESTSLVEVTIETGRTHQIRIHLAALGYPLEGDALYPVGGVPDASTSSLPGDLGYFLHAHSIRFPHPAQDRSVSVSCLPPPILRRENL
ncbi:MAG: RluA family pseudouridine synthase [Acidobacteriota bacterium]|nr:MAG: RluA family pseudouridine synthase [Acidobacteriota bacterium]